MVLVLSLGIGTNVVLFTVMNSLATLPAPGIPHDDALVRIRGTARMKHVADLQARLMSWPEVREYAGTHGAVQRRRRARERDRASSPPVTGRLHR